MPACLKTLRAYLSIYQAAYVSVYLSIALVHRSIYLCSIYLSICLSVYPPIYPSTHLSLYLFISRSICLSSAHTRLRTRSAFSFARKHAHNLSLSLYLSLARPLALARPRDTGPERNAVTPAKCKVRNFILLRWFIFGLAPQSYFFGRELSRRHLNPSQPDMGQQRWQVLPSFAIRIRHKAATHSNRYDRAGVQTCVWLRITIYIYIYRSCYLYR